MAVAEFLNSGDDWLLSWHSDVVGDPKTLMRLLSWDKPLVSALIFMRTWPVMPHIWKAYPKDDSIMSPRIKDTRAWFKKHAEYMGRRDPFVIDPRPDDALVNVDFTSTSCVLIHRSVLTEMHKENKGAWFKWDDDFEGGGEDRNFYQHAKLAGFDAYVDRSCVMGHLVGDIPTSAADFFTWDYVSTVIGTGEPPHEIVK
jgi:hypothetical protein